MGSEEQKNKNLQGATKRHAMTPDAKPGAKKGGKKVIATQHINMKPIAND